MDLMCGLTAEVAVPNVTVGDVLSLSPGSVLNSHWRTNRDLPLKVNGRLLGFAEFEGSDDSVGVRLTEFVWEQQH